METGTKVKLKKGFNHGIITFEEGDILKVANYIHKFCIYLKHDNVIDLVRIAYEEMDEYFEVLDDNYEKLFSECLSRDWSVSLIWQRMTNWSVEIYTGYEVNYNKKFFTSGHIHRAEATKEALRFLDGLSASGVIPDLVIIDDMRKDNE
ncbi:hypothetical protein [Halarcobacter sp.]|uniref:hypothetical protein n=1 Tax=Halarcobacter sp. TaxID=2321133 RepID=UPI0029F4F3E9|nr:hypothetical protein [Halarcobacter sp.]